MGERGDEPTASDADFRALCDDVRAAMERLGVPGVAVGVLRDDVMQTVGFGITNVEAPVAVDDHTLFQIGSITKTFTGTAILRLVEAGTLALDVTVRTYLPELRLRDEDVAAQVTIRHLLSHTGGWYGGLLRRYRHGLTTRWRRSWRGWSNCRNGCRSASTSHTTMPASTWPGGSSRSSPADL